MRILILVENSLKYDERVKRQIKSLVELGHNVEVIELLFNATQQPTENVHGAKVYSVLYGKTFKGLTYAKWIRVSAMHKLSSKAVQKGFTTKTIARYYVSPLHNLFLKKAASLTYDVVVGNDLNAAVSAMELSKSTGKPFVYDAHEYYSGQSNRLNEHEKKTIQQVESEVVKAAAGLMTVSYSIKDKLNELYGQHNWSVILNIPEIKTTAHQPADNGSIVKVVYHTANLSLTGRNVQLLIDAIAIADKKFHLTLIGNCKGDGREVLKKYLEAHIANRYELKDAMPLDALLQHAATCDIGAVLNHPSNENNNLTIPNKIFEYMAAGLAIVSFPVEGTRFLFEEKEIGTLTPTVDEEGLKAALEQTGKNTETMMRLKANSYQLAHEKYNWENEKCKFEQVFGGV